MIMHKTMQLEGTLDQFPLDELIGLIVSTIVTGVLEIGGNNLIGRIFFRDGRMYHAETSDQSGFDALCRLFEEHDAPFCFTAASTSESVTLWNDVHALIAQAQQQAQQWQQVRRYVQNLNWIPVLEDTLQYQHASQSPILAAVDGQRSIAEIADALGYVPLEIGLRLCELHEQGVIAFRQTAMKPAGFAKRFSINN